MRATCWSARCRRAPVSRRRRGVPWTRAPLGLGHWSRLVSVATAGVVTPRGDLALIGPALFVATAICLLLWLANVRSGGGKHGDGRPRPGSREREAQVLMGMYGERHVGEILARELPQEYVLINGLKLPRGAGDIDHLVVGPTGVFLLETKTMAGRIVCELDGSWRRTRIRRGGTPYAAYIGDPAAQVQRNIFAVRESLRTRLPGLFQRSPLWIEGLVVFAHPRTELQAEHSRVPAVRLEEAAPRISLHVPQRWLRDAEVDQVVEALLADAREGSVGAGLAARSTRNGSIPSAVESAWAWMTAHDGAAIRGAGARLADPDTAAADVYRRSGNRRWPVAGVTPRAAERGGWRRARWCHASRQGTLARQRRRRHSAGPGARGGRGTRVRRRAPRAATRLGGTANDADRRQQPPRARADRSQHGYRIPARRPPRRGAGGGQRLRRCGVWDSRWWRWLNAGRFLGIRTGRGGTTSGPHEARASEPELRRATGALETGRLRRAHAAGGRGARASGRAAAVARRPATLGSARGDALRFHTAGRAAGVAAVGHGV